MATFDLAWSNAVHAQCDPVFAAAEVGFSNDQPVAPGPAMALLWEAEPVAFAAKYPDSGIIESYGADQWPGVHCIDFWLYIDADAGEFRISVEGLGLACGLPQSQWPRWHDGMNIASVFARILNVPFPLAE